MCYIECINTGDTVGGNGAVNLDYKSGECLHEQIKNEIKRHIINGILEKNEQLPSVRDLSLSLTVNPNTVQRAYSELEDSGLLVSNGTLGRFVTEDGLVIEQCRKKLLLRTVKDFTNDLAELSVSKEQIISLIEEVMQDEHSSV